MYRVQNTRRTLLSLEVDVNVSDVVVRAFLTRRQIPFEKINRLGFSRLRTSPPSSYSQRKSNATILEFFLLLIYAIQVRKQLFQNSNKF